MRGLAVGLVLLALTPPAGALTVSLDAPRAAPADGTPTAATAQVQADEPVELRAWMGGEDWQASRTWNGTAFQRSDRYATTVDPGPDGRWRGPVWVRANPDSRNHDRLRSHDELAFGLSAREGSQRAQALDHARRLGADDVDAWAAAGPNRSIHVADEAGPLAVLGSPDRLRPIRVPAPVGDREVCPARGCSNASVRIDRADEARVRLAWNTSSPPAGGVLVADGEACALPAPNGTGPRWVELAVLDREGLCREAGSGPGLARLFWAGREVSRVPDRPGRGHVARDPVTGDWAPWRLPERAEPAPVDRLEVTGRARAFATETEGLAVVEDALERARERVVVATYLFTSRPVAERLAAAAQRGVDVDLYVEPDPVGGFPEVTDRLVDWLEARGVTVHEAPGPSNAGLQHAKIVVVDGGLAIVLTENLTGHGLPTDGEGNLGVGLAVANRTLAQRLEAVFQQPGEGREIRPQAWPRLDAPVDVVTAPENAWRASAVPAWIRAQEGPIEAAVLQANTRWGPRENPWLSALVDHSRNHSVDLLLSGAPESVARSNRQAAAHLQAHPRAGDLDVRLSDPREGTVHAKVLAGPSGALVGSTNWGMGGALFNREVNLLVHDARIAEDVDRILDADRSADEPALPDPASVPSAAPLAGLALVVGSLFGARRATRPGRRRARSREG